MTGTNRPGRRLGVDVGSVRVGIAMTDPDALLAAPLVTLARDEATDRDLEEIAALVAEHGVRGVVVGLPLQLSGLAGAAAATAQGYAEKLAARVRPIPVHLVDERLSTVTAQRSMTASGRSTRRQRRVIDQVAAVVFLQAAVDAERASGALPGDPVVCAE